MESVTGIEPANLFLTKEVLCQLSYTDSKTGWGAGIRTQIIGSMSVVLPECLDEPPANWIYNLAKTGINVKNT
jgi:hypothetical protein